MSFNIKLNLFVFLFVTLTYAQDVTYNDETYTVRGSVILKNGEDVTESLTNKETKIIQKRLKSILKLEEIKREEQEILKKAKQKAEKEKLKAEKIAREVEERKKEQEAKQEKEKEKATEKAEKEKLKAEKMAKEVEEEKKEQEAKQEKAQKKEEKELEQVEKKKEKAEEEKRKLEKAAEKKVATTNDLKKANNSLYYATKKYEKLKYQGKLSPNDETKWAKKLKKLKTNVSKIEEQLNKAK